MFKVFTISYDEQRPRRAAELELCLAANLTAFDAMYIVDEGTLGRRQKFEDLFRTARLHCSENDICVVCNADVFFTKTALNLIDAHLKEDQAYCLTRWDLHPEIKLYDVDYSQDAWITRGPPRESVRADFDMGGQRPGCDNKIAWEFRNAGYSVSNPSRDVKMYHAHSGETHQRVMDADKAGLRLPRPYLMLKPHLLGEKPTLRERS